MKKFVVPEFIHAAVYACGSFDVYRTPLAAHQGGESRRDVCCDRGGHEFRVVAYQAQGHRGILSTCLEELPLDSSGGHS